MVNVTGTVLTGIVGYSGFTVTMSDDPSAVAVDETPSYKIQVGLVVTV